MHTKVVSGIPSLRYCTAVFAVTTHVVDCSLTNFFTDWESHMARNYQILQISFKTEWNNWSKKTHLDNLAEQHQSVKEEDVPTSHVNTQQGTLTHQFQWLH